MYFVLMERENIVTKGNQVQLRQNIYPSRKKDIIKWRAFGYFNGQNSPQIFTML